MGFSLRYKLSYIGILIDINKNLKSSLSFKLYIFLIIKTLVITFKVAKIR